jgi:hypothetical protein
VVEEHAVPETETDLDVESRDVFAIMQSTRVTALGSLVGTDLETLRANPQRMHQILIQGSMCVRSSDVTPPEAERRRQWRAR